MVTFHAAAAAAAQRHLLTAHHMAAILNRDHSAESRKNK